MNRITAALLIAAVGVTFQTAVAVSVVAPNYLATTEGDYNNSFPFSDIFGTIRYQQVFASSQFAAIPPSGAYLTTIAFRPDLVAGEAFSKTISQIRIDLSTTAKLPNGLSLTFAENLGANNQTVVGLGSLTFSSAFVGPANGPKDFDILIPLTTPFYYAPSAGNLLMDVRIFDQPEGVIYFDAEQLAVNTSRVFEHNANATTGSEFNSGLVAQFTFVPEPSTLSLAALGLLFIRRRASR